METIKETIAANIAELRKQRGMTQLELAEALNYSDKAISKWERGESIPDVTVLVQIAGLFAVPLDYLVEEEHPAEALPEDPQRTRRVKRNRVLITGISVALVWLIASFLFTNFNLIPSEALHNMWQLYVYAVPASCIVWLVFNALWFDRRRNFLIISLLLWSTLAAICISMLSLNLPIWQLFVVGVPGQIIIGLWSGIRRHDRRN